VTEQGMFEKLKARGEEVWNRVSNELMQNPQFIRALQGALKGKELVDQAVARALKSMNVPNRSEFKRALHRTNVGSRKIAISRNVAPGKLIQLVANLYDRRHRQSGGNGHQHDQYDRDPHDLTPNGQADHVLISLGANSTDSRSSDGAKPRRILSAKSTAQQWP